MCDLIDLNSPDARKLIAPKLASPLIPPPPASSEEVQSNCLFSSHSINNEKRSSLDNNPFDKVFRETAEYLRKKEDPFEIVLEKALKCKSQCNTPKARSVEFQDDFTPKRTRYSDVLKMNKTLDESMMDIELNSSLSKKSSCTSNIVDESIIQDLNNTNLLGENDKSSEGLTEQETDVLPVTKQDTSRTGDLSILNQSAMNDTLSESSSSSEENQIKFLIAQRVSLCVQKGAIEAETSTRHSQSLRVPTLRRSLSQGAKKSPRKLQSTKQRSQSIIDTLKADLTNEERTSTSSVASSISDNPMNKAFLRRSSSISSVLTDLSNISSITRFNSATSVSSGGTINRAFIDSFRSKKSFDTSSIERSRLPSSNLADLKSTSSISSVINTSLKNPIEVSDLARRLEKLKVQSRRSTALDKVNEGGIVCPRNSANTDCNENMRELQETRQEETSKLIDVDVFVITKEENTSKVRSESSGSYSSDSVFTENTKFDESILDEAKALARTFESLAKKRSSQSSSSGDDLVNSRPHFDLLPASDDEALVDNLIELPASPNKPENSVCLNTELEIIKENKLLHLDLSERNCQVIKELETEFIDDKASEKRGIATTLLLDLEKLVRSENNPEAMALLENLEKALGVGYKSNSELLAACLHGTNDLNKSPKKSANSVEINENIKRGSIERSLGDNSDVESLKEEERGKDTSLDNNLNTDKEINKIDKSVTVLNDVTNVSLEEQVSQKEVTSTVIDDDPISAQKKANQIAADQKMAMDLLVSLEKVLGGQNEGSSAVRLLANLGRILNLAANNKNPDNIQRDAKQISNNEKGVSAKKTGKLKQEVHSSQNQSNVAKSMSRRSLDSVSKVKLNEKPLLRRSISGNQVSSTNSALHTSIPKDKSRPQEIRKRFPSDPGTAKDVKSPVVSEVKKVKPPTVIGAVKNKFRKNCNSDVVTKKGPMKAIIPLGNMQRPGSLGKKVAPLSGPITPPKSTQNVPPAFTVTSSTPNSVTGLPSSKKSTKNKPVASSTPDTCEPKTRKDKSRLSGNSGKRNFSCNISPVTPLSGADNRGNGTRSSPQKHDRTLSPPKRQSTGGREQKPSTTETGIPKYSPLVGQPRRNSFNGVKHPQEFRERSKSLKLQTPPGPSLNRTKKDSQIPQSPLKNSSNSNTKMKPVNLISKLRRRSGNTSLAEKENLA